MCCRIRKRFQALHLRRYGSQVGKTKAEWAMVVQIWEPGRENVSCVGYEIFSFAVSTNTRQFFE